MGAAHQVPEENLGKQTVSQEEAVLYDTGTRKEHINSMTEIFRELAVVAEPVWEEDHVVHLLASLPDSYDMLVTAMESGAETVPPLETVTEKLLKEERKLKEREQVDGFS